jgi:hypothetical protein
MFGALEKDASFPYQKKRLTPPPPHYLAVSWKIRWVIQPTLCLVWVSHIGVAEKSDLLGCYTVWNGKQKCFEGPCCFLHVSNYLPVYRSLRPRGLFSTKGTRTDSTWKTSPVFAKLKFKVLTRFPQALYKHMKGYGILSSRVCGLAIRLVDSCKYETNLKKIKDIGRYSFVGLAEYTFSNNCLHTARYQHCFVQVLFNNIYYSYINKQINT